jgi:uncharacterized membrane protein YfcA
MGLAIGVLTGLFGVGGGFMVVPLLNLVFGIDYIIAVGSSLSFTVGAGATGLARHARMRNVDLKTMLLIAGGAVCGAVLGAMLLEHLRSVVSADGADGFTHMMDALFIVLLLGTAPLVWRRPPAERGGPSILQRLPIGPHVDLPHAGLRNVSLPGLCLLGTLMGVLTGLLGVGGGILLAPALIGLVGLSAHQAVGTSLGVVVFSSISGTIKYGLGGYPNLWIAMALLVGSAVGVQLGAWICAKLHAARLRRYFVVLILLLAAALLARVAGLLG